MKKRILFILMLLIFSLFSCNKKSIKNEYLLQEPDFNTPIRNSKNDIIFEDLFNLGNTVNIDVSISNKELEKLQMDYKTGYKSEIYRLADKVSISIKNYEKTYSWEFINVGIRQKGNTSRLNIYDDEGNICLNHFKLSFDETFNNPDMYDSEFIKKYGNEQYKSRDFLGLEGLDIRWNKNYDSTNIREIYSSYLYKASGLISQTIGLSTFSLIEIDKDNRKSNFGLCTIFEPANKGMIKRNMEEENILNLPTFNHENKGLFGISNAKYGDLYKCGYGIGEGYTDGADMTTTSITGKKIGVGNISGSYIPAYERKTNQDCNYDDKLLKNMISVVNNGSYDEISNVIDLDYLAIEEAVSYIIGNPDAMRYNYNNYMIYFRKTDGKAIIIPIDNDRCFGIIKDWNVRDGLKNEEIFSKDASKTSQRNPLLNKTILSSNDNDCKQMYYDFIVSIAKSPWVLDITFEQFYNIAKKSYPNEYFNIGDTSINMSFNQYMKAKLDKVNPNSNSNASESHKIYNNLYVVGTFNNWGNYSSNELELYKLKNIKKDIYEVSIRLNKIEEENNRNYIKFKFNNGYNNYNEIDWTVSSDLSTLITSKDKSCYIYDVNVGDIITFNINVVSKVVIITIE